MKNLLVTVMILLAMILIKGCTEAVDISHSGTQVDAKVLLANGDKYQGALKDGLFHGQGKIYFQQGGFYEGDFSKGLMSGDGVYVDTDLNRYEGQFEAGLFHGKGKYIYSEGAIYEGQFRKGKYHGKGKYTDGEAWFEGTFESGTMVGQGAYLDYQGNHYTGDVDDWYADGIGELTNAEGAVFSGEFKEGSIVKGEVKQADGHSYIGHFSYGEYEGEGVLTMPNGNSYRGEFSYGKYHGQGTLTEVNEDANKQTVLQGKWQNGTLIENEITGEHFYQESEIALERHQLLLNSKLLALKESDNSSSNVYFLGVAGDGTQSVFRREIETVSKAVGGLYDTDGRSLTLINHHDSAAQYPMATRRSIATAINAIGQKMDAEQDILFMHLSSHGSKDFRLSLRHDNISLPDLSARDLSSAFNKANIKWKIIVISACYSGGFIPELQDDTTLIITAADHESTSFGCSEESEMTYFSKALYSEVLTKDASISLSDAFEKAKNLVQQWEEDEELSASNPKMFAPEKIIKKISEL